MRKYKEEILNSLLNQYERSSLYKGTSLNSRKISLKISPKTLKDYFDENSYQKKEEIDHDAKELQELKLIEIEYGRGFESHLMKKITLNLNSLDEAYRFIRRIPRGNKEAQCISLLKEYERENNFLGDICKELIKKLEEKASIKKYLDIDNLKECTDILLAVKNVINQEEEIYKRNFSLKVFGDSKKFEVIESKVLRMIKDFLNDESLTLEEFNIFSNPSYVYFKGNGKIILTNTILDISELNYGIGISSKELNEINNIDINDSKIITIENLTTFNTFNEPDFLSIYLGGFHNKARRDLLKKIKANNKDKQFYHFGDIDCGGFKIFRHLVEKTEIDFIPYNMNIDTLIRSRSFCRELTLNDINTLEEMLKDDFYKEFYIVFKYMLENNIKLEQEWFG
jgi:hypothetical protein